MAQRDAVSVSPDWTRLRGVLWLLLRPLGRLFQSAAGPQWSDRARQRVRWPGHISRGTKVTPIAGAIDLLPTLAELAGIAVASQKPLDGRSLAPLLLGKETAWPDRMIFSHWNGQVSVRTQQYRLD